VKIVCNSVCAFVFRRSGDSVEYLLLRRTHDRGGFWQPVTGRVEKREKAEDAARREVFEETGFKTREFLFIEKVHVYFKPGKRKIYAEPCFGIGINGADPVLCKEHDKHAWLGFEAAVKQLPHSGLREALTELHAQIMSAPSEQLARREPTAAPDCLPFKDLKVVHGGTDGKRDGDPARKPVISYPKSEQLRADR